MVHTIGSSNLMSIVVKNSAGNETTTESVVLSRYDQPIVLDCKFSSSANDLNDSC